MSKTLKFEIITGVNKGYFHENKNIDNLYMVSRLWQKLANEQFNSTGIYISASVMECKTVYRERWGCPKGGEDTIRIIGTLNLNFAHDIRMWKLQVLNLAKKLKESLQQSTLSCEFSKVEMCYFKDK